MIANLAGNEVIQIQLLERLPHGGRRFPRRARRFVKENALRKRFVLAVQKTQIERARVAHADRSRHAIRAGMALVLDENRQAVHEQRLRDSIHHRSEHRVEAHFRRERAAKLNQRAAIVQAVPVKKAVQARLNPVAKRLEQKCRHHDGDHSAHHSGRPRGVEQRSDHRHDRDVHGHHAAARGRIGETSLEDDVHVHQAVADDGVAETQRDQHQRNRGEIHPRPRHNSQEKRHDVKQQKWNNARQRSAGHPLQLLPQDSGRCAAIADNKNKRGQQEVNSQTRQVEPVERISRFDRRHETQFAKSDQNSHQQQNSRHAVNGAQDRAVPLGNRAPLRKYQRKMQQQRRLQKPGHDRAPIDFPVERSQLPGVLEGVQDEGHQAKNVEMHGARRVPPAGKNEEADEEVQHAHNAQIIFDRGGPRGRLDYELRFKLFAAPLNAVMGQRPQSDSPQALRDIDRAMDRRIVNCKDLVVGPQAGVCGGRVWRDMPGNDSGLPFDPRHPIIGRREHGSLLKIDDAEDNGCKSRQG